MYLINQRVFTRRNKITHLGSQLKQNKKKLYHVHHILVQFISTVSLWSFIRNPWPFSDSMCLNLLQLSISFDTQLSEPDEWRPLKSSLLVHSGLPGDILKSILAFPAQQEFPCHLRLPSKELYFFQWRQVLETKSERQGAHESHCGHLSDLSEVGKCLKSGSSHQCFQINWSNVQFYCSDRKASPKFSQ